MSDEDPFKKMTKGELVNACYRAKDIILNLQSDIDKLVTENKGLRNTSNKGWFDSFQQNALARFAFQGILVGVLVDHLLDISTIAGMIFGTSFVAIIGIQSFVYLLEWFKVISVRAKKWLTIPTAIFFLLSLIPIGMIVWYDRYDPKAVMWILNKDRYERIEIVVTPVP